MQNNKNRHANNHSAEHNLTRRVPLVHRRSTIGAVHAHLSENIKNFDTIDYLYVVDESKKLLGVFSIKELYTNPPETKVDAIKKDTLITIPLTAKLIEVANLAIEHNIKAIPVVSAEGEFEGVVPNDVILETLKREHRKDLLRMAGIHESHLAFDNTLEIPIFVAIKHRIPWLFVGLGGGLLAAEIIGYFEHTLQKNIILAAFIPLVVYIADAVGTQLESFVIRDFALYRKLDFFRYFTKQFSAVFVIAILLGGIMTITSLFLHKNINIAFVLGSAIIAAVLSSLITGIFVPFIFRKFKIDPANASGPIATIVQDVMSVFIYFLIASAIL